MADRPFVGDGCALHGLCVSLRHVSSTSCRGRPSMTYRTPARCDALVAQCHVTSLASRSHARRGSPSSLLLRPRRGWVRCGSNRGREGGNPNHPFLFGSGSVCKSSTIPWDHTNPMHGGTTHTTTRGRRDGTRNHVVMHPHRERMETTHRELVGSKSTVVIVRNTRGMDARSCIFPHSSTRASWVHPPGRNLPHGM